jgi:hypothetical protein
MEEFIKNPNETTASLMLEKDSLVTLVNSCRSVEVVSEMLRLLFQLNKFNMLNILSIEDLCGLLNAPYLSRMILENLQVIDYPPQDYSLLISKLFDIFASEDVGQSKLSHSILLQKFANVISSDLYLNQFLRLMSSQDSIIKVRAFELVIDLANSHPQCFEVFERNRLIDMGLEMITCGDILLQIVAIEVVVELGRSEAGCKKLLSPAVQSVLVESLATASEVNFKNRLILMIGNIVFFTGNLALVNEKFWKILHNMLSSSQPSSVKNALTSLGLVSSRSQGLLQTLEMKNVLSELKSIQRSANSSIKSFFYHFFSGFLELLTEDQTNSVMSSLQPLNNMMNELLSPFQDHHSDILQIIIKLVQFKDQAQSLLSFEKFQEYLFRRPPHQSHEVSSLKFQIIEGLHRLDLPDSLKTRVEKYLKAGVCAVDSEDVELDSMN